MFAIFYNLVILILYMTLSSCIEYLSNLPKPRLKSGKVWTYFYLGVSKRNPGLDGTRTFKTNHMPTQSPSLISQTNINCDRLPLN